MALITPTCWPLRLGRDEALHPYRGSYPVGLSDAYPHWGLGRIECQHCELYAYLYYMSTSHMEDDVDMSHRFRGGFQTGVSAIFFAYISSKTFAPAMGYRMRYCQGLTDVRMSENGPKWLISLEKLFFLYIYPVFKLLI